METKLTTRQWALYNYLKAQAPRKVGIKEIHDNIDGYSWHDYSDNKLPQARVDMKAINESHETDAIIVLEKKHYYFANEEELEVYREKLLKKAMRCLHERKVLKDKRNLDGQYKLLSNRMEELSPKCKEAHETLRHDKRIVIEADDETLNKIAKILLDSKDEIKEAEITYTE